MPGSPFGGQLMDFANKFDQIAALNGWLFDAHSVIAEPAVLSRSSATESLRTATARRPPSTRSLTSSAHRMRSTPASSCANSPSHAA
ncbi:hypothetical protein J2Y68_000586 [Paenarthrobacter nitroguajacolicus]|nr:hypothetical protein [Paenarthrobacter nitroguajacolicus]